jgi:hypothetical protein
MWMPMRNFLPVFFGLMSCTIADHAFAARDATEMTYVEMRFLSPEIKPGTFEASARKVWRSGVRFIRLEEAPDTSQHIWGLTIVNEPDIWMWNRFDDTAKHIVDQGPSFVAHLPVFTGERDKRLLNLEVGREKEFFAANHASQLPDKVLDGVSCETQSTKIDDATLTLYLKKLDGRPYQISIASPRSTYAVRYEKYEDRRPMDLSLFKMPSGPKVTESK